MENEIKDGGPAFPLAHDIPPQEGLERAIKVQSGMSLRDYFAAKALPVCLEMGHAIAAHHGTDLSSQEFKVVLAGDAYAWADAMLAAREGEV